METEILILNNALAEYIEWYAWRDMEENIKPLSEQEEDIQLAIRLKALLK
jgi:hypothetical protein